VTPNRNDNSPDIRVGPEIAEDLVGDPHLERARRAGERRRIASTQNVERSIKPLRRVARALLLAVAHGFLIIAGDPAAKCRRLPFFAFA
jgi:hypothetical protein